MMATSDSPRQDPAGAEPAPPTRPVALVLARIHLRLGALALAQAELEILAREGALDTPGQVDLAEVRWRTGDLTGAGEAASVALAADEDEPMALVIAAEAAAGLGRPNEARRLANRALERLTGSIDGLFAGMPRSAVWPADASEPPPSAGTMFHSEAPTVAHHRAGDVDPAIAAARRKSGSDGSGPSEASLTLGIWDTERGPAVPTRPPDPADELEAARDALAAGSIEEATLRFALVLRLAPALAPAILEATDGLTGPAANVVRGDAYRLVGLEMEARRAYAAAHWSGPRDRRGRAQGAARQAIDPATETAAIEAPTPEA